jgi:hypothetical protein
MDPHLRMEKILAVIEANPGINGQEIAAICALPWGIIKKDLKTLSLAIENTIPLYSDPDGEDMMDDDWEINIKPETRWFLETHTRRNVPLHLTLGEALQVLDLPHVNEKHPKLQLLKQQLFDSLDLVHRGTYRYIKGNMVPVEGIDGEILLLLEQAIIGRRQIAFTYYTNPYIAGPLGLVYYSRLRQWYLVAQDGELSKTYNLSKMQGIKELTQSFKYPVDFSLSAWLAPRWGMEFGEPLQVKVRFINRSQTIAKVRKDVAHRQCVLKEENGGQTLLYEDIVIGKNEFIAWILGFGSAAEVLEPPELRTEIISRVKAALANYK